MATLLVTGGAGFIGSNLVRHALDTTAHDIIIVDKLTYASSPVAIAEILQRPRVTFIREDIADEREMACVFRTCRPSAVLNLAAETHVDRSIDSPRPFVHSNVVGTMVLLDAARRYLRDASPQERDAFRFLHVSTDEVFGTLGSGGLFTEGTSYQPSSPYAASKAGADHLVRAYFQTYGLPTLVTNCSNNYGPFQHPEKLIPLMVLNAMDARALPIYGDGLNVRDWLHVEDHCAALMLVLQRGRPGESYNVGAANEQCNLWIVDRICEALEQIRPAHSNPAMVLAGIPRYCDLKQFVADRPGHDRRYAVDATKIRHELGWEPQRPFADGLAKTVEWYVEHRERLSAGALGYDRERLGLTQVAF